MIQWPSEPPEQTVVLKLLASKSQDSDLSLLERQAAWDYLLDVARNYLIAKSQSEAPQFDDMPIPLAMWCMLVAVGDVKPPGRGRGRPGLDGALQKRKILAVVEELGQGTARTQDEAVTWVAEALGYSGETIRSDLRIARRDPHTFADTFVDNALAIWGEKIP